MLQSVYSFINLLVVVFPFLYNATTTTLENKLIKTKIDPTLALVSDPDVLEASYQ